MLSDPGDIRYVLPSDHFADNVRRLREQLGMTQEELAEAADLHRDHVSKIENRLREPKVTAIAKLGKGLKVPLGPLFEDVEP